MASAAVCACVRNFSINVRIRFLFLYFFFICCMCFKGLLNLFPERITMRASRSFEGSKMSMISVLFPFQPNIRFIWYVRVCSECVVAFVLFCFCFIVIRQYYSKYRKLESGFIHDQGPLLTLKPKRIKRYSK